MPLSRIVVSSSAMARTLRLRRNSDPPLAPAPVEATFLRVFLLLRAYHLFSGALTLSFDRRRYVRPAVGWAAYALLAGESTWLSREAVRRGDYTDSSSAFVDVGIVGAGLVLCSAALPPSEQFNASNWMFPVGLMSGVGAMAAFPRRRDGILATGILATAFVAATGLRSKRWGAPMILGVAQFVNCAIAGDLLTRRVRATTAEIALLRADAVVAAAERGRSETRRRLRSELHLPTLETLRIIRERLAASDPFGAQSTARVEAARLRRTLRSEPEQQEGSGASDAPKVSLRSQIEAVVERYAASMLRIEFVDDLGDSVATAAGARVVCDALGDVLEATASVVGVSDAGSLSEIGFGRKLVVALTSDDDVIELSIRTSLTPDVVGRVIDASVETVRLVGGEIAVEAVRGGGSLATIHVGGSETTARAPEAMKPQSSSTSVASGMNASVPPGATSSAAAKLERVITGVVVAARTLSLAQTVFAMGSVARNVHKRAPLYASAAALTAESGWAISRTVRRASARDPLVASADVLVANLALVGEAASWGTRRFPPDPRWAQVLGLLTAAWTSFGNGDAMHSTLAAASWIATYMGATSSRALDRGGVSVSGQRFSEMAGGAAFYGVGASLGQGLRTQACELDTARFVGIEEAERRAAEFERFNQLRMLHDSVLQVLETVAGSWQVDGELLRRRIDFEIDRLERVLAGGRLSPHGDLSDALVALSREFALIDLDVRVDLPDVSPRSPRVTVEALNDAAHEALTNVHKHAGTGLAHLTLTTDERALIVTIEDHGCGFDPSLPMIGFGVSESIHHRLEGVGGSATIESAQGIGTTVTLRMPQR